MKRLVLVLVGVAVLLLASPVFACQGPTCNRDSNVGDTNDGNRGDIFVYDCEKGAESLGRWVDPKDVPELKGEKGDRGEKGDPGIQGPKENTGARGAKGDRGDTGPQGIQGPAGQDGKDGAKGDQGEQGVAGQDGRDGLNGSDGRDGKDGAVGPQGEQGVAGQDGKDGAKGDQGEQGVAGLQGDKGDQGLKGDQGKDVDPATVDRINETLNSQQSQVDGLNNRVGALERTQYIVGGEIRLFDSKKWQISTFADYSTTRSTVDRAGLRVTYKMGQSYEERRLDALEKRVSNIAPSTETTIVKNTRGEVVSMSIHEAGATVNTQF